MKKKILAVFAIWLAVILLIYGVVFYPAIAAVGVVIVCSVATMLIISYIAWESAE